MRGQCRLWLGRVGRSGDRDERAVGIIFAGRSRVDRAVTSSAGTSSGGPSTMNSTPGGTPMWSVHWIAGEGLPWKRMGTPSMPTMPILRGVCH